MRYLELMAGFLHQLSLSVSFNTGIHWLLWHSSLSLSPPSLRSLETALPCCSIYGAGSPLLEIQYWGSMTVDIQKTWGVRIPRFVSLVNLRMDPFQLQGVVCKLEYTNNENQLLRLAKISLNQTQKIFCSYPCYSVACWVDSMDRTEVLVR